MAWVQGQCVMARVTLYPNKQIKFNNSAFVALSDGVVDCLGVFYDSDTKRLGFRRGSCMNSVRVLFNDSLEYRVDAEEPLESLGVVIAEEITLALQSPAPPTPTNLGDEGIYWVQLPE